MKKRIELDDAKKIIESAFLPLHCNVEFLDNRNYIRFQISDENGKLLGPPKKQLSRVFRTPSRLKFWICRIRTQLKKQGFQLLPWDLPDCGQ
jgi:hypothetical protein